MIATLFVLGVLLILVGAWLLDNKLNRLLVQAATLEVKMEKALEALTEQVRASTEIETSAVVLIKGIADKLAEAGTDPEKLSALTDELHASSAELAAALTANTPEAAPAAPAAEPAPAAGDTTTDAPATT